MNYPSAHDIGDYYDDEPDECPNCGGEGYVACCFEEYACVDPEGGCDQCMRRCDWCRPSRPAQSADTVSASPHDSAAQAGSRDGAPKRLAQPERGETES